jgi:hypothetical protein
MIITPNMALVAWNADGDDFDHTQLATDIALIDGHDHSAGKGKQLNAATAIIPGSIVDSLIAAGTITGDKIASGAISTALLADGSVTLAKLAAGVARMVSSFMPSSSTLADNHLTIVAAGVTATLPASPEDGETIVILASGGSITVHGGGGNVFLRNDESSVTSFTRSEHDDALVLVYSANVGPAWYATSGVERSSLVTTLSGFADALDGQIVDYQADSSTGTNWRFRYNGGSSSSYKWEFLGGVPLLDQNGAMATSTVTSPSVSPGSPSVTLPFAGDYIVTYGGNIEYNSPDTIGGAGGGYVSLINAPSTVLDTIHTVYTSGDGLTATAWGTGAPNTVYLTGLAASTLELGLWVDSAGQTANPIGNMFISVTPVRVA